MQEFTLTLSAEELNFVAAVLGNLPTQSNAWPILQKIEAQAKAQLPKPETAPTPQA